GMSHPPAVDSLEDYVWGRIRESDYLEKVARADSETADVILARVQLIDTDLNRQLRRGVEENLSRLLDQTTALEGLERRQKNVHVQMDYVKEGCSRIAQSLASQLSEYREGVEVAGRLLNARNILGDAMRCEELMDQFDKRRDLVKRSEIICEMRWILKENPSLHEISWLVPTIGGRLKKATTELQSSSSEELRRGLDTLNSSTVSASLRALKNLGTMDGELESVITRSMASLDSSFLQLAAAPSSSPSLLPSVVNGVQTQLEQAALLGENHLIKVSERLGRTMRARVPLDAPYALRLVQSVSRVLASFALSLLLTHSSRGGNATTQTRHSQSVLVSSARRHQRARSGSIRPFEQIRRSVDNSNGGGTSSVGMGTLNYTRGEQPGIWRSASN
ncbi:hypothetical protein PMAYCL1PPCAC_23668, partial [Pristionchus mayeri]